MNTKSITDIIAEITAAKLAIKGGAAAARANAPKGEKVAHGQHFAAEQSARVAGAALGMIAAQGFKVAAVSGKVTASGREEFTVTYRRELTLAQRIETAKNSAARQKAKRDALKAGKAASVAPVTNLASLAASLPQAKAA